MPLMLALLATLLVLAFPALLLAAAVSDATSFTIPNWIPLALLALFPLAGLAAGVPLPVLGLHAGVGLAGLIAGMVVFSLGWMGGGDAKLIAAVALWLGWPALTGFLIGTAMVGGGLALLLMALRAPPLRLAILMAPRWVSRLAEPGQGIPYGVAIAVGALFAFPASPLAAVLNLGL